MDTVHLFSAVVRGAHISWYKLSPAVSAKTETFFTPSDMLLCPVFKAVCVLYYQPLRNKCPHNAIILQFEAPKFCFGIGNQ
jgi:hypothetical protein